MNWNILCMFIHKQLIIICEWIGTACNHQLFVNDGMSPAYSNSICDNHLWMNWTTPAIILTRSWRCCWCPTDATRQRLPTASHLARGRPLWRELSNWTSKWPIPMPESAQKRTSDRHTLTYTTNYCIGKRVQLSDNMILQPKKCSTIYSILELTTHYNGDTNDRGWGWLERAAIVRVELPVVVSGSHSDGVLRIQQSLQLSSALLWEVATQPPAPNRIFSLLTMSFWQHSPLYCMLALLRLK